MYSIYKLTLPDGRAYIGMTQQKKLYNRWQYGSGYSKNIPFYNEIVNCGWKNIKKEVLEQVPNKELALIREKYYIGIYKTFLPEYGFNTHGKHVFDKPKDKYKYLIVELNLEFNTLQDVGDFLGLSKERIRQVVASGKACRSKSCHKGKYHVIKILV